jgi:uncharacterized protein (TIGR03435 family)
LFHVVMSAAGQKASSQAGRTQAFEAATIKPTQPEMTSLGPMYDVEGKRFVATNHTIRMLIAGAYGRKSIEIVGPELIDGPRFDIQAVLPEGTTRPGSREMVKALLAERFSVRVKEEDRMMNVHVLQRVKEGVLGPGLKQVQRACDKPDPKAGPACWMRFTTTSITVRGRTWPEVDLATNALGVLETRVIDRTGLTGQVDMDLSWQEPADGPRVTIELTSDILNAVRDQLGLKVERQRERVPVLVVERVAMPTAN